MEKDQSDMMHDKKCGTKDDVTSFPSRYAPKEILGRGSYGTVKRAYDRVSHCDVAIKQIKANQANGFIEIEHLLLLNGRDELDDQHIIRMCDYFLDKNGLHLVFELMDLDLSKRLLIESGLSLWETRDYARQICIALNFLSRPEIRLMHCDLKPDNILLRRHGEKYTLKIADFGLSCRRDICTAPVQVPYYRAPEVALGIPYTTAIDMWSFGCIAVEMQTNKPLFRGLSSDRLIGSMVEILGMPPKEYLDQAPKVLKFFDKNPTTGEYSLKDENIVPGSRALEHILGVESGGPGGKWRGKLGHEPPTYRVFLDFIKGILKYQPNERLTPEEALKHDFFIQHIVPLTKPRPLKDVVHEIRPAWSDIILLMYPW